MGPNVPSSSALHPVHSSQHPTLHTALRSPWAWAAVFSFLSRRQHRLSLAPSFLGQALCCLRGAISNTRPPTREYGIGCAQAQLAASWPLRPCERQKMQSVERGETEAGPGGAFSSGAGACPSRGGKSPPRGKMEARRARRFQGRWLSSFLFSLSQAAPSVSCTVVLGTDAVLPAGDHFPIPACSAPGQGTQSGSRWHGAPWRPSRSPHRKPPLRSAHCRSSSCPLVFVFVSIVVA